METQTQQEQPKKSFHRWLLLLVIAVIVALIAIGIFWILSYGGIIDRNWSLVLSVLIAIASLAISIFSWFFPNPFVKSPAPISLPKIPHEEDTLVPFNEILERELRKRKWKEEDLAKKLGVPPQIVYKWEKGE